MRRMFFRLALSFCALALFVFSLPAEEPARPEFILKTSLRRLTAPGVKTAEELDRLQSHGYDALLVDILDAQGNFHFYSPQLRNRKWQEGEDLLSRLLEADAARKPPRSLKIIPDISGFARAMNAEGSRGPGGFDEKEMSIFVLDFYENYGLSGFASEPFPPPLQAALHWTEETIRGKLTLLTVPGFFDAFLDDPALDRSRLLKSMDRIMAQDFRPYPLGGEEEPALPTVGEGDAAAGFARARGLPLWIGFGAGLGFPEGSEHNFFLYRALQNAASGYCLLPASENDYFSDSEKFQIERDVKADLLRYLRSGPHLSAGKKPVANLVLGVRPQRFSPVRLAQFIEPVMNALLANGYELQVSFGELIKGADLYYVTNSEEWAREPRFFRELLDLLDEKKSHFYGRVILHPMGEMAAGGLWKKLREIFGVPETETGWLQDMPAAYKVGGREIRWKGTMPSPGLGMTHIREEAVRVVHGEPVMQRVFNGETLALVLRAGNHYLVNGNLLHLESAYLLSNLMGGALQAPFLGYVTASREGAAALAIAETTLKLKIPTLDPPPAWKLTIFDRRGKLSREESAKGDKPPEVKLRPFELLIVQPGEGK